jgi:hypothetical protein
MCLKVCHFPLLWLGHGFYWSSEVLQAGKAAIELNPESRVQTEKHLDSIKGGRRVMN